MEKMTNAHNKGLTITHIEGLDFSDDDNIIADRIGVSSKTLTCAQQWISPTGEEVGIAIGGLIKNGKFRAEWQIGKALGLRVGHCDCYSLRKWKASAGISYASWALLISMHGLVIWDRHI